MNNPGDNTRDGRPEAPTAQLLLVKRVFDDAICFARQNTATARLYAMILLDLSVELGLNLTNFTGSDLTPPQRASSFKDRAWNDLWRSAESNLRASDSDVRLPHAKALARLHEVRNLAQHNGTVPDGTEIQRYVEPARSLLAFLYDRLFNLRFDGFHSIALIENHDLRGLLEDVRHALDRGKSEIAAIGLTLARRRVIPAIRGYFQHGQEGSRALPAAGGLGRSDDHVTFVSLGMPPDETRRFLTSPSALMVAETASGRIQVARSSSKEEDSAAVEWSLGYLCRLILLVQERCPACLDTITVARSLREQSLWKKTVPDED